MALLTTCAMLCRAVPHTSLLLAGVIVVALGTRYQNYCANVSRTYIINPSKTQEAQYTALLNAHEAAMAALKEGAPAKAAMEAVHKVCQSSEVSTGLQMLVCGGGDQGELVVVMFSRLCRE
jgi:Xaa-Pro aminopeptidase